MTELTAHQVGLLNHLSCNCEGKLIPDTIIMAVLDHPNDIHTFGDGVAENKRDMDTILSLLIDTNLLEETTTEHSARLAEYVTGARLDRDLRCFTLTKIGKEMFPHACNRPNASVC